MVFVSVNVYFFLHGCLVGMGMYLVAWVLSMGLALIARHDMYLLSCMHSTTIATVLGIKCE
jgi:hypothetical protein